ncbi:Fanconi anemia group B protein [Crotalus adamanteus]|uniref:Fanconi anemia group B protein n=1 Tax=Crotalus adamanteus TaxID=8729 RepID=A0AAW1BIP0_CROAD
MTGPGSAFPRREGPLGRTSSERKKRRTEVARMVTMSLQSTAASSSSSETRKFTRALSKPGTATELRQSFLLLSDRPARRAGGAGVWPTIYKQDRAGMSDSGWLLPPRSKQAREEGAQGSLNPPEPRTTSETALYAGFLPERAPPGTSNPSPPFLPLSTPLPSAALRVRPSAPPSPLTLRIGPRPSSFAQPQPNFGWLRAETVPIPSSPPLCPSQGSPINGPSLLQSSQVQIAAVDGDRQLVIVTFASGDVCAIWKHNLQVASCWKNVKSVLVDDFAGIGTEQILVFLKSDSVSETLKAFQIADFGNINYESNVNYGNVLSSAEEIQENRLLTIKALEARLQAGFASVRTIQQHLHLKEKVLIESCHALLDLVQDRKQRIPRIKKENLISLWDEREEEFHDGALTPTEDEKQIVKNIWYRVVDNQLIVGVEIMETFDFRQLSDGSLSLIIGQKRHSLSPSKCHCKVVTIINIQVLQKIFWHSVQYHTNPLSK